MKSLRLLAPLSLFIHFCAFAAEAPPAKALKYHEALLKRPSNETLFDRFFGAWIDERDVAELELFLKARAEENGGPDLSILARYQLRRGDEEQALATLGKAIAAVPGDFSLPMERAKILMRRLEFEAARKDLEAVAAGGDTNLALEASKLIGKSWLREGDPEQAIKAWDKLLAANPEDEDLLEDLVESAAAEGETAQALAYVEKLIAAGSDPYKKTLRQLRRGDLLAQAGRNDDAIQAYSETLAQVGEGSWLEREVLAQIDKAYRKQDRIGDLKAKFAELAEANPRRLLIHRQLAKIEAAEGETDAAVGRFREVLKRSPGNRELREEFVRLLTDGEKFGEAVEELGKLIAAAPEDAALLFQMADLRNRQKDKEGAKAALEKARSILGNDEAAGIRIAGLMFQYDLAEAGENLLKSLEAAENATIAPSEALASQYARSNRKPEALAILKRIGASDNLDVVLRSAASISALGESADAFGTLSAKAEAFGQEPRFLAATAQSALAADKPEAAVKHAVKLVRLSRQSTDLAESIGLALRAIVAADQSLELRETLEKQETRTPSETCLLAALMDANSDYEAVSKIMEGATDPVLIRFHSALLDRRGDFTAAIAVLARLAETDEGRKASFFKDMTDLQRRAGLTEDALATAERWKQSAPGDKTAWVTASSILREEGRPEEAVKMTRQAVARFDGDTDLAATLASLHEEAGQMEDAEAIYWRLYDASEKPSDQARWAVQLAELSLRTGRTDELGEKLRERARSNRRSIGPILAQAELARITQDEEKRRDLLLEAIRLQPKDTDLRLQAANLEEQSGNPDRVIAILEEAVDGDSTGRIRSALAQAYLRQGQTLKGMRELRAIAGKQGDDPRSIEQSAAMLAGSGLYEEAIRFLREALPDGGDWRSRYLLATMLEQDGRETEAIPIFQSVREATGELPGKTASANPAASRWNEAPEEIRNLGALMLSGQLAYAHRNTDSSSRHYGQQAGSVVGPFVLPDEPELARNLALIHLAKLGAGGVENAAFINDLTSPGSTHQPDFPALLAKYPDEPGLFEMVVLSGAWNSRGTEVDKELLAKLLAEKEDLSPAIRFYACHILSDGAEASDPVWGKLTAAAADLSAEDDGSSSMQVAYLLLRMLSDEESAIPEKARKALGETLLRLASSGESLQGPWGDMELVAINVAGTREQWIAAANERVARFAKEKSGDPNGLAARLRAQFSFALQNSGYNPWMRGGTPFSLPDPDTIHLSSLPSDLVGIIRPTGEGRGFIGFTMVDPAELIPVLDSFTSPTLRAWIAIRAGDEAAAEKALSATPPENEANDFRTLLAYRALAKKDYVTAYRLFSELRPAYSADRNLGTWLNFTLIAIAREMDDAGRKAIADDLRPQLIQARRVLGPQAGELLASQAAEFGMPDLAKRFLPPVLKNPATGTARLGPAGFGTRQQQSGGNSSIDRMKKFSGDGKHEAAAMEALNLIRKANANPYNRGYEMREIKGAIAPETVAELLRITDPGDSKSLTKLTEYADICVEFGKREVALSILTRLNGERPDDTAIAGKLAFLLPADQRGRAAALMTKAASDDSFIAAASSTAETLSADEDNDETFAYFGTIADWLASAKPEELAEANLSWIPYHANGFFRGQFTDNLPALTNSGNRKAQDEKAYAEYIATARRLAEAMLLHSPIAEEGFRLLNAPEAWEIPPQEMDRHARNVLGSATLTGKPNDSFFTLRRGTSYSRSGDARDADSSVAWLVERLSSAESPDEIIPPDYLRQLTARNPEVGRLVSAIISPPDLDGLETLWKSDALAKSSGPYAEMLRQGVLARAGSIPGVGGFFLERIRELKPGNPQSRGYGQDNATVNLFSAALQTASQGEAKDLDAICTAISKALFGDNADFSDPGRANQAYQGLNLLETVYREGKLGPAAASRVHRAMFRLGIPAARNDYAILQPFRTARTDNTGDAEKLFSSFGWLDGADTWEPFAAILIEPNHSGRDVSFTRKEVFLQPEAHSYMGVRSSDMLKALEARKPQTFGSLITAASLVEGSRRGEFTAQAFELAAPELARMAPGRLAAFAPVLPWLPPASMAKLPPALRKMAASADADRLKGLTETADKFLKGTAQNNPYNNPFDEAEELVQQLAPLDLDKAVAVFLEAERRFTASLGRGGQLSSGSYYGLMISERDNAFGDLFTDSDSPLSSDTELALRFHAAIAASDAAGRFGFVSSRYWRPLVCEIAQGMRAGTFPAEYRETQWIKQLRAAYGLPEPVRKEGIFAALTFRGLMDLAITLENLAKDETRNREDYEKKTGKKLPPTPAPLASLFRTITVLGHWEGHDPKERQAAKGELLSLVGDGEIAPISRFQLLAMLCGQHPSLLADADIAGLFAESFESYAKEDRSVINGMVLNMMKGIADAPHKPELEAVIARINKAFWENANAPKPAGHPPIPPLSTEYLLVFAARAGDAENTKKLLAAARPASTGNVALIHKLILAGKHELARQLLAGPKQVYFHLQKPPEYDRAFETRLSEFREAAKSDPVGLLRLEAQFRDWPIPKADSAKPLESASERELRLCETYRKNPPQGRLQQTGVLSSLCRESHTAALLLHDEILALAGQFDAGKSLRRWGMGTDDVARDQEFMVAVLEMLIIRQAAFLRFLDGDVSGLAALAGLLDEQPLRGKDPSLRNSGYVEDYMARINESALIWICEAVHRDRTAGFGDGFGVFRKFYLIAQKRSEFSASEMYHVLAAAEYLAYWNGSGEEFRKLADDTKREKSTLNYFGKPEGLYRFAYNARRQDMWESPSFAEARRGFLIRSFTRKGMDPYYPPQDWVTKTSGFGLRGDLLAIAGKPPGGTLPNILPFLLKFRSDHEFRNGDYDTGVTLALAALDACPAGEKWDFVHMRWGFPLTQKLISDKKPEAAKAVYAKLRADTFNKDQRNRYDALGKKL